MAQPADETTAATLDVSAATVRVGPWPMWVLGFVVLIDQVDQNLVRGVVPQPKSDFGIDDFGIGVLISAFVLVNGIVTVPAGYLADRWHRTRTIGHTVVAWSGITMLTAASQNFGQLLAGRALLGFGQAVTEPSANSLISDYYPTEQRGTAFSVQQIMGIIGFGLGIRSAARSARSSAGTGRSSSSARPASSSPRSPTGSARRGVGTAIGCTSASPKTGRQTSINGSSSTGSAGSSSTW